MDMKKIDGYPHNGYPTDMGTGRIFIQRVGYGGAITRTLPVPLTSLVDTCKFFGFIVFPLFITQTSTSLIVICAILFSSVGLRVLFLYCTGRYWVSGGPIKTTSFAFFQFNPCWPS